MHSINKSAVWTKLLQHQQATQHLHMRDLFNNDVLRFKKMHCSIPGLLFDYSKNRITEETLQLLIELANVASLREWMEKMRRGEKINLSENRSVLHTALRQPPNATLMVDGKNVIKQAHLELARALNLAERIRNQIYTGYSNRFINHIVNIGIGGSDLGPSMLYQAFWPYHNGSIKIDYVSNVDAAQLVETLKALDPSRTLFIVASKSLTTRETLLNAEMAKHWFREKTGQNDLGPHFAAVTGNAEAALTFGIDPSLIFHMFNWVGGRYSIWSTISLSIMCAIGREHFLNFLAGAYAMDQHFFSSSYEKNIPVLMGLIGVWYNTFYQSDSHAIIPYDHSLRRLPAYIQQLDMESNGKYRNRQGDPVLFDTGAIIWGGEGINCQHAFFQLLHQGTRLICSDFILVAKSFYPDYNLHHRMLVANGIAQTRALMQGKTEAENTATTAKASSLSTQGLYLQQLFPGNQPTNTIFLEQLTPFNLGQLLALYEHKVFVQGIIWGINSFDQWGVEYGKVLAKHIEPLLHKQDKPNYDCSTNELIAYYQACHGD